MTSVAQISSSATSWGDFPLANVPTSEQLNQIKIHLDLVLLGLEALTDVNPDSLVQVAQDLGLKTTIVKGWQLWQQRQSLDTESNQTFSNQITVEEARSLIVIICHLCQQNQEFIRRAATLLEQMTAQGREPLQIALLREYFDKFERLYRGNVPESQRLESPQLWKLAFKLLVDLLFYSATNGHRRLWLAMLDYTR